MLLAALVLILLFFRTNFAASTVRVSWSYDYGAWPACSAARTQSCLDHFEVQELTSSNEFKLLQSVNNPAADPGAVDRITTTFRFGPVLHDCTIAVTAVARDSAGQRVTSNPYAARVTLALRPGAKVSVQF